MEIPHEAVLLRIFMSADDRYGVEEPLYRAIVMKAREMHLAGATVLKGPLGFGHTSRLHEPHYIAIDERPVVIEICDAEEDQRVPAGDRRDDGKRPGHTRTGASAAIRP
jgi:uncharacterized protein